MREKKPDSELITAQAGEAFNLWDMPSFDTPVAEGNVQTAQSEDEQDITGEEEVRVEEVAIEEVKPLTLDEVEAIRQDAWNEGFSTGEKDGFHAGQMKAAQEAEVVLQNKVQTLDALMHEFFEPIAKQDQALEEMMLELVMQISQQVIQRELSIDSSQIKQVVRESLKLLPMGSEAVRVHVNPQDFEQIKALRERHEGNWRIVEDDDLLPGGCRFESLNTQINATIESRIEKIAAQILEQQRELHSEPLAPDLHIPLDASQHTEPAAENAASPADLEQSAPALHSSSAENSTAPAEPEPTAASPTDPTDPTASPAGAPDGQAADDNPPHN